ncbi:uncharacterized protein LOC129600744 [Paramacrobiotus metropolitanus]|uniref:uncharacterized protein LOC129600744 n=1 Tax=Paramacrobiotus metropolitanus TaxID=2943436 RepID=UPI0024464A80|nr:uncharacterized protein LOC129600744 [Paramacrobiotus metropolitanus]
MDSLFFARGKVLFPLTLGILLVIGFATTASIPSKQDLALLSLVCRLDTSMPVAEQKEALEDCVTTTSTNFRRLVDGILAGKLILSNSTMANASASSVPLSPPTTTTVPTPETPTPGVIQGDNDVTPPSAAAPRPQKISWLRYIVQNLSQVAERHPFFAIITGLATMAASLSCFMFLVTPRFLDALEKRTLRGRVMLILGLLFAIAFGAWIVDSLWQALY